MQNTNIVACVYTPEPIRRGRPRKTVGTLPTRNAARGKAKSRNHVLAGLVGDIARLEYLRQAVPSVSGAAKRAIQIARERASNGDLPYTVVEVDDLTRNNWFYATYLMYRRDGDNRLGRFYSENWELLHTKTYNVPAYNKVFGHVRYEAWQIFEQHGAGPGAGRGRFVMLDDRKIDVFIAVKGKKVPVLMYALWAWDVLTHELLYCKPVHHGESVKKSDYAHVMLKVAQKCGCLNTIWFLENSAAAKSKIVREIAQILVAPESLEYYNSPLVRKAFGSSELPIVRNQPHMPNAFGKATGERLFLELKKLESFNRPMHFFGSGTNEMTKVANNLNPAYRQGAESLQPADYDAYVNELTDALYNWYQQPLSSNKSWAKAKGLPPTIGAMIEYYATPEAGIRRITDEQEARLRYVLSDDTPGLRARVTMRQLGGLEPTFDGDTWNLRAFELCHPQMLNRRFYCIKLRTEPERCAAVFDDHGAFICVGRDITARTAEQQIAFKLYMRRLRAFGDAAVEKYQSALLTGVQFDFTALLHEQSSTVVPEQLYAAIPTTTPPSHEQIVLPLERVSQVVFEPEQQRATECPATVFEEATYDVVEADQFLVNQDNISDDILSYL